MEENPPAEEEANAEDLKKGLAGTVFSEAWRGCQ